MAEQDNTPQTGNEPQGDAAPQQTNPVTPEPPVESDEVRGLKAAAEAERKKRQELETQLYQTQGLLSRVAVEMKTQPVQKPDDDYLADLSDNDLLDPARVRQGVNKAIKRVREEVVTEANQTVQQLRFNMDYPDFSALVGTRDPYTGAFRPSEIFQEALSEDPDLQRELTGVSEADQARIAYRAAKYQKRLREARTGQQQQTTVQQQQAQAAQLRHAANTAAAVTQPMSPSAVSGSPANSPETDYRAMASDPKTAAQFDALIQNALRGKFG